MRERLQEIRDQLAIEQQGAEQIDGFTKVKAADLLWLVGEIERLSAGLQRIANHRADTSDERDATPCPACSAVRVYARSLLRGTESTVSIE